MAMQFHHVQVPCPPGAEDLLREFYGGVLGLTEIPKPPQLAGGGGVWFRDGESGAVEIHCGVEEPFLPPGRAHPGIAVDDVDAVAAAVTAARATVVWDDRIAGLRRFHTRDPVGNRLEFQQSGPQQSGSASDRG
jgi:catechol 2,3-dioxygenase-like lactoylglutathione lyase family enzyme